jgi:hypothetical protein
VSELPIELPILGSSGTLSDSSRSTSQPKKHTFHSFRELRASEQKAESRHFYL